MFIPVWIIITFIVLFILNKLFRFYLYRKIFAYINKCNEKYISTLDVVFQIGKTEFHLYKDKDDKIQIKQQ